MLRWVTFMVLALCTGFTLACRHRLSHAFSMGGIFFSWEGQHLCAAYNQCPRPCCYMQALRLTLRMWAADVADAGEPWARMSAKAIGPSRFFVVDRQVPEANADTVRL